MTNEQIGLAFRVLKALARGQEPYAAGVGPMAALLQTPEGRAEVIAKLRVLRDELGAVAWLGSVRFSPYERVCDVLEELGDGC